MVGLKNLATFVKGFCGSSLGWMITKYMVKRKVFKCYIFGNAFEGGGCLHPDGLKNLTTFLNNFY